MEVTEVNEVMWPLATKLKTIVMTRKTFVDNFDNFVNFERSDNFIKTRKNKSNNNMTTKTLTKRINRVLALVLTIAALTAGQRAWAMQIFIHPKTGNNFTLEVEQTDGTEAIKAKIEDKKGIPSNQQHLYYNNAELEDGHTLSDYNIPAESTLNLFYSGWAELQEQLTNSSTDADNPTVITLDEDIEAESANSYLEIPAGHHVIIDLNGHTIDRNLTEPDNNGQVFYVKGGYPTKNPASLTIRDSQGGGTITGGYPTSWNGGGAFFVTYSSTLTIEGGTITGNKSAQYGGGAITATNRSIVRMTGGSITGNVGNTINDDYYYAAGAICLKEQSHFYLSGGSITGNLCGGHTGDTYGKDDCGGIGFDSQHDYVNRVHLSGTYTLSGNLLGSYSNGELTNSIASDYLHTQNNVIVIEDAINPTAPAVITVSNNSKTQVLTSGWGNHMTADPATCFTLSSFYNTSGKGLGIVNGEVSIGTLHTITLGDNITASATSAAQGKPITLGYTGTVPKGYAPVFSATAGSINGNILVMPDEDVNVSVIFRLAIPYSYDFEEEWSWDEWSSLSGSNERVQGIHHSGSYNLIFKGSTNNIVVLPQFQNESNTLQISFWTRPESNTMPYCGTFSVGYLTDPADASTFSAVKTYRYDDWTTYYYLQKTVYLNNVPGGARIAFRHNPESPNYYWFVDDVEVSLLPSCIPPENLSVSGIGASAATFSWTAAEGADWEYGIVANAAQNYVPTDADFTGTTTANSVTLNTLSQLTSYTFYLRRACSAQDKSEVVSVSFSTTQTPVAVPFSDDFEGNACQWVLENSNDVNQWYWGNAASCGGTKALYISNDGGNSNSFSTNSSVTVYATKMFTFADGDYYLSYNWRCSCDDGGQNYMRVALAPASASLPSNWYYPSSLPSGWIALDGGYTLSFASQWQAFQSDAITVPAGQYKMVVVWTNCENTSPLTYPAAIDNICISTYRKTFTTAGYWNEASNWSPEGVPASTEHVRINAAATIPSGCVVEAAGIFIDYDNGSLTLADGGQLVCYHNLNVTVQKEIAAYTTDKNGWNLFAMPFSSNLPPTLINGLIPSDPNTVYDLYRLNEETTYWENYKQHGSDFRIHPNNNYGACLYANSAGTTLQRYDQIYPNSVAGETAQLRKQGEGWHLIANPYTCTAYVNKPFFRMNATGTALEYVANYWETPLNVCEGIVVKADHNYESVSFTRTAPAAPSTIPATMPDIPLQLPSTHGFGEDNAAVTIISDNADNADVISANQGSGRVVILKDRTFWKDGYWNTLCLPFPMTSAQVTAQLTPAALKTLSSTELNGNTLKLNFTDATEIVAGKPYIIKWASGSNLVNPTFTDVTVSSATANVTTTYADFIGTYNPINFTDEDKSILFLGAENKLYWPQSGASIGACRGYFQLNGITVGNPNSGASGLNIVMDFGDDATSIRSLSPDPSPSREGSEYWYDMSGRKLSQQPTQKGVYIHGGHKVVLK